VSATRLLILGILQKKQPLHGYAIRRELELWNTEKWANIAYGSIYSALNKMAEEELIEAVNPDQTEKRSPRTEYIITESGKQEFERLLRDYWWAWKPVIDPFQVALTFMDCLPREELLAALRYRAEGLRSFLAAYSVSEIWKVSYPNTPRHIAENLRLVTAHSEAELRWLEEVIGKVERGELP